MGKITVLKPVPAMTQTAGFPDSVNGVPLHRQLDPLPCTLCTHANLDTCTLCAVHTCKLFTLAHFTMHSMLTCTLAQITADQRHHCWSPVLAARALSWLLELCPGTAELWLQLPETRNQIARQARALSWSMPLMK